MIRFTVPGTPVSKERPRKGKGGRMYTPAKTVAAEQQIEWLCKSAMKGARPLDGPVEVNLAFVVPDRRVRDLDNMAKTVLDAMNKLAYTDDSQIIRLTAEKRIGTTPGTEITVRAALGADLTAP